MVVESCAWRPAENAVRSLSDSVFAFAMMLLALGIALPALKKTVGDR